MSRTKAGAKRLIASASTLVRWLSPPCCLLCKKIHDRPQAICRDCEIQLPRNSRACRQCGIPLDTTTPNMSHRQVLWEHCIGCHRQPPLFQQTLAPFLMHANMRELIHLWKFQGQSRLTPLLGALFVSAVGSEHLKALPESTVLVPVPTYWHRQVIRGYDHTWMLAQAVRWQLPEKLRIKPWLHNTRYLKPQHRLNRRTRINRGSNRFVASRDMAGQHIILIDDVMTTGATAGSAATACDAAGALSTAVWCLARTPLPEAKPTDTLR